jgi:hypothetical protein
MNKIYLILKPLLNWFQKETPNSELHARNRYAVAQKIDQEIKEEAKKDSEHQLFNPH